MSAPTLLVSRQDLPKYDQITNEGLLRAMQRKTVEMEDEEERVSLTSKKGKFLCRRCALPDNALTYDNTLREHVVEVYGDLKWDSTAPGGLGEAIGSRIAGMQHCGTYACPVCAGKKVSKAEYVPRTATALKKVQQVGGEVLFMTLTIKHRITDQLDVLLMKFKHAYKSLIDNRGSSSLWPDRWAPVSSYENNYGRHGHHLHLHVAVPLKRRLEDWWDVPEGDDQGRELVRRFRRVEAKNWGGWGKEASRNRQKLLNLYRKLKEAGFRNQLWDLRIDLNEHWRLLWASIQGDGDHMPAMLVGLDIKRLTNSDLNDAAGYLYKGDKEASLEGVACEVSLGGITKEARNGSNVSMSRLAYDAMTHHDVLTRGRYALAYREWETVWSKKGFRKLACGLSQLEKQLQHIELEEDDVEAEVEAEEESTEVLIGVVEKGVFNWGNFEDRDLTMLIEREVIADHARVAQWLEWTTDRRVRTAALELCLDYAAKGTRVRNDEVRAMWLIGGLESDRPPPDAQIFLDRITQQSDQSPDNQM